MTFRNLWFINTRVGIFLFLIIIGQWMNCGEKKPGAPGLKEGKLTPCPDSPNCVSSESAIAKHHVTPLVFETSATIARSELNAVINSMPGTKVVEEDENYLHAEFKIPVLGFIDDVEFYLDAENKIIHVRSASRLGYWDWGVNRRRVEKIRKKWNEIRTR